MNKFEELVKDMEKPRDIDDDYKELLTSVFGEGDYSMVRQVLLPTDNADWDPTTLLRSTVGGIGDCWTELFADYHIALEDEDFKEMRIDRKDMLDSDEFLEESRSGKIWVKRRAIRARSLHWLLENLIFAIRARVSPIDYTRYSPEGDCYICFEKKPEEGDCECYDAFDVPEDSEEVRMTKEIHVRISVQAAFVFHISGCRWSSFNNLYTMDEAGNKLPEPRDYSDLRKLGWISLHDLAGLCSTRENVSLFHDIPGYKTRWVVDLGSVQVGADAADMVNECKRINTAELAKAYAQEAFSNDISSISRVNIRLTEPECRQLKNYVGFPVMSNNKKMSTSDHKMLQASRELIRNSMRSRFPHNVDMSKVLHIGCTFHEYSVWKPNVSHDFLFNLTEDRDVGRVFDDLVAVVGRELRNRKLPGIKSTKEKPQIVTHTGVSDVVNTLNSCLGRDRILLSFPTKSNYNSLMYEDCLYNVTEEQILSDFSRSGATTAWATIFLPDVFITNRCLSSGFYRYEEYYDCNEVARDFVRLIWPEVALIVPLFPLDNLIEAAHTFFSWVARKGAKIVVDWIKQLPDAKFPLEEIFGVTFDILKLKPIFFSIMESLKAHIKKHFCRVRITWKGGYDSGYDHKWHDWSKWITTRRIRGDSFCVDWSIIDRIGEMYLLRLHKSTGTDDINFCMDLPKEKVTVMVADVSTAWSPTRKTLGEMEYFPVLAMDWYKLYNWAMAEPIESLDFSVVLTTLNRIRGGLSLNSNVLVEPMHIQDTEAVKLALACLLEVVKMKGVLSDIENVKENLAGYHTNLKKLLNYMGTTAATICTAGVIVPAVYLLKWLFDANPNYVFVKETVEPKTETVKGKKSDLSKRLLLESAVIKTTVIQDKKQSNNNCFVCNLQSEGVFKSKVDSNAVGQEFICKNPLINNVHNIGFKSSEMSDLTNFLTISKSQHEAFGAKTICAGLSKMRSFFEKLPGGVEYNVEINSLSGGPGTGKSVVIREIANILENCGKTVAIIVPYMNLMSEYRNCELLSGERKDFECKTMFCGATLSQTDVLIFDEMTGVREDLIRSLAIFLGAKAIWLVGDNQQTKLNPSAGEGVDPTSCDSWDWENIQQHEMVWNFRLDAWRVKYLNKTFGYSMRTVREDALPPVFITRTDYNAMCTSGEKCDKEMVFSHQSGSEVFGVESTSNRDGINLSVRSNQGQTCTRAAVSYMMADVSTADVHGMLCVAISRSRRQTYFIVHDLEEPHVKELKDRLYVSTTDKQDEIMMLPFPKIERKVLDQSMSFRDKAVNEIMTEKRKLGYVSSAGDEPEEYEYDMKSPVDGTILLTPAQNERSVVENGIEAFKPYFHFCAMDTLFDVDNSTSIMAEAIKLLSATYNDDILMGRSNTIRSKFVAAIKKKKPLPVKDGKRLLPIEVFTQLISLSAVGMLLTDVQGKVLAKSLPPTSSGPIILFTIDGEHLYRPEIETLRRVPVIVGSQMFTVENMLTVIDGKYVGEYELISTSRNGYCYALPDVDTDLFFTWLPEFALRKSDPVTYVGYKPTYRKLFVSDIPPLQAQEMTKHCKPMGSYVALTPELNVDPIVHAPRLGKDAYKLAGFLDPSGAMLKEPCVNNVAPSKGPEHAATVSINWEGFIWDRTKAGTIKRRPIQKYRAIMPGLANHYNNSPEETLIAAQRLGRPEPKPSMTKEAIDFARTVANHAFDTHFTALTQFDWQEANAIIERGMRDAHARNYYNRATAENKPFQKFILRLHNKDQIKPIKNDELNLEKGGQGILQTPSKINLEFVCWMRVMNYLFYKSKRKHFFYDNLIPTSQFRKELTEGINSLPNCVSVAIADAKSFDSQQSPLTLEIERQFMLRLGAHMPSLNEYYKIREPMEFRAYGYFSGKTKGEKGSGFPDTLLGNTILQTCLSTYVFEGVGPMIVAAKGDDHLRIQCGVKLNEEKKKKLKTMTNIQIVASVGIGGEFCGDTITRKGAFPSIKRATIKALAMRAKDYNQFTEKQESLRDKIHEYQVCGLEETVAYAAQAEGITVNYVQACLAFLNSYAHISKAQWKSATQIYAKKRYFLPGVIGPQII
uniref:Polyprotein n=1 Tax=Bemisia tabaci beny-like virus 4 TaxID=2840011 RepID=A0A8E8FTG6_9VIRU|nr:polyprotein [Bemisia tabaci beny-like virus 4]